MNNNLMEQLLNENESTTLDFKREQYHFQGATNRQKSELLKDIITFANAWRRTDSYILIGVEEVKGGRSDVLGVTTHLDDAKLQQFVNSKTNRSITFTYEIFPYDGVKLGIIRIPLQQNRPIFLTKDYGNLKKNVVYIRRGSSTDIANPDEIVKMKELIIFQEFPIPELDLQFADIQAREELGNLITLDSEVLEPLNESEVPDAGEKERSFFLEMHEINKDYYREMIPYVSLKSAVCPIGFVINNVSPHVAKDVHVRASGHKSEDLFILDESQRPKRPVYVKQRFDVISAHTPVLFPDVDVDFHEDNWSLNINFGKIQPKDKKWSNDVLYIGVKKSMKMQIDALIYADNLPEPIKSALSIDFKVKIKPMTLNDLWQDE